ncbi:LOW QUALITY PROTEIN: MatE domain-containing protein [Cephalotus follicularis]|uniref:Protein DETOXIFICATION n=1 Tax=Cephalotus follicularis TaxID=3775 RepID=A0A1Q3AP10_CEPFO|nr:LOW QUALITY PROTEIN: MatE domain-containing protein [Cephalotus follicularis]
MDERLLGISKPKDSRSLKERVCEEEKKIWRVAFPAMLARTTNFGAFVVTQAFIGHIGAVELAGYALIQVILVRFANGILLGMSSATETLCGQAFGAKQYHMLGIYLQRSWIINLVTATLILPVFIFSTDIFELLGEEDETASAAGYISLWFIPILYSFVFNLTIQKYLQAQLKNQVIAYLSAFSFALHVLLSWIFVSILNWEIPGAMAAMIISNWLLVIGEVAYLFGGWCSNTWKGFTSAAFVDLLPVIKLSISSGVMLCLELWYNAVLVLLAGYMKNATVAISAFSICLNVIAWIFMISIGFLGSASVRISNELGRGNANAAKFSIKVITCTSICVGVFFWILCLVFRHVIAHLFTTSDEVAESVSSLSVLLAFSVLLNSVQAVLSGMVAVGAGRQSTVAYVNIGCYYVVGVPVGVLLGYVADLEVTGIWIGMMIGVIMQSLVLGFITWRTDWDEQVNKKIKKNL